MIVSDLIKKLQEMPQDLEVVLEDSEWGQSEVRFVGVVEHEPKPNRVCISNWDLS